MRPLFEASTLYFQNGNYITAVETPPPIIKWQAALTKLLASLPEPRKRTELAPKRKSNTQAHMMWTRLMICTVVLLQMYSATACKCAPTSLRQSFALRTTNRFVRATVLRVLKGSRRGQKSFLFRIDTVYKGCHLDYVLVSARVSSAACGIPFRRHVSYVMPLRTPLFPMQLLTSCQVRFFMLCFFPLVSLFFGSFAVFADNLFFMRSYKVCSQGELPEQEGKVVFERS